MPICENDDLRGHLSRAFRPTDRIRRLGSFHLYTLGYVDEHEYAVAFRPIFIKGLFTSLVAVGISFILRIKSDHLKDKYVKNKYDAK